MWEWPNRPGFRSRNDAVEWCYVNVHEGRPFNAVMLNADKVSRVIHNELCYGCGKHMGATYGVSPNPASLSPCCATLLCTSCSDRNAASEGLCLCKRGDRLAGPGFGRAPATEEENILLALHSLCDDPSARVVAFCSDFKDAIHVWSRKRTDVRVNMLFEMVDKDNIERALRDFRTLDTSGAIVLVLGYGSNTLVGLDLGGTTGMILAPNRGAASTTAYCAHQALGRARRFGANLLYRLASSLSSRYKMGTEAAFEVLRSAASVKSKVDQIAKMLDQPSRVADVKKKHARGPRQPARKTLRGGGGGGLGTPRGRGGKAGRARERCPRP